MTEEMPSSLRFIVALLAFLAVLVTLLSAFSILALVKLPYLDTPPKEKEIENNEDNHVKISTEESFSCPYCRESIFEDLILCPSCETLHHNDCWNENSGCTRYGCKRNISQKKNSPAPAKS